MSNKTYEAFDGKIFDNFDEYYDYENVAAFAPYEGKICFLNSNMEKVPLLRENYSNRNFEYLCIADDATAQSAAARLKQISDWFNFPTEAGFYQTHPEDEEWFSVDDICESLKEEIQEWQDKRKLAFEILGR